MDKKSNGNDEESNTSRQLASLLYPFLCFSALKCDGEGKMNDASNLPSTHLRIALPNDGTLLDVRKKHFSMEICCDHLRKHSTKLTQLEIVPQKESSTFTSSPPSFSSSPRGTSAKDVSVKESNHQNEKKYGFFGHIQIKCVIFSHL